MQPSFPFQTRLSLRPLIAFWQSLADQHENSNNRESTFVSALLREVEEQGVLNKEEVTAREVESASSLLRKLMSAVFPLAASDRQIAAAIMPFELAPFFSTPMFDQIRLLEYFSADENASCPMSEDEMRVARTIKGYHLILERLYGTPSDLNLPFVVGKRDPGTGLERFFQIELDSQFVQIRVKGQKPRLTAEQIALLLEKPLDVPFWRSLLPPERFRFEGFGIIRATEVTFQQVLSLIKNDLLDHHDFTANQGLEVLQGHLRSLLGIADLDVGILALEGSEFAGLSRTRVVGKSLLLSEDRIPDCPRADVSSYVRAAEGGQAVFLPELHEAAGMTGLEWHVHKLGYRSLAVIPLSDSGRVVGLLELVSRTPGALSASATFRLSEVTPLLTTALNRTLEERENRIQSIIKKQYTAIHPIVEWRFRDAAIKRLEEGPGAVVGPIVFDNVFPLYGLSDIRNSSTFRAEAVSDDLTAQLGLALAAIIEASSVAPQPALDELGYRLGRQIDELQSMMAAGDETEPLRLLREEVEPLFDQLASLGPSVARRVAEYRKSIDPQLGMVYRKRRDFEQSLTMVNDCLSRFLEARDEAAQQLVPHYFEKYRTDGVDYNIYVGASLRRDGQFDELDLRNLRLWQLMTMAGCVWEVEALKPELPLALSVTHLILAQSQPLAIRFRPDEKKFDVDGAYNIRYEIVKKRIDKAEVRGTGERLTQPGKIAIAYSQSSELREYRRYIDYLQSAGYLEPEVEMLELEPLQGVHGLRAIRVTVAAEKPESDFLVDVLPAQVGLSPA